MFRPAKTTCLLLLLLLRFVANSQRFPVVIHEIMADPQPAVGLPEAEYVELRNTTTQTIDLAGWRLQTASAISSPFPSFLLQPDSLVVLTSRSQAAQLGGNTLGIAGFPPLPNSGALLTLRDVMGAAVHAVQYQPSWYRDTEKAGGGWSLEMIDALNPCGAGNWQAATHPSGGTPGRPNSVAASNPDQEAPALVSAIASTATQLLLRFDEPMDSVSLSNAATYIFEPAGTVVQAIPLAPLFNEVSLTLARPMAAGERYRVSVLTATDCAGNTIGSRNQVTTGLPQNAMAGDVVINEILFNPKEGGSDYVELFNNSNKILDLSRLRMGNEAVGAAALQKITESPQYLFPGGYLVLTEHPDAVLRHYLVKEPAALLEVARMPSLPDDKGSFLLLDEAGNLIDALQYAHTWHFALIAEREGIALERILAGTPTQSKDNWTSAAASAGFGTPTYRNSQYLQGSNATATLEVAPQVCSPDGDGFDDFCTIRFGLPAPNFVGNASVYDLQGRKVRQLASNQTLGQSGSWRWDGLGDNRQPLASGTYILLVELFNLEGKRLQFKRAVGLARK